jgi:hypothetical protein
MFINKVFRYFNETYSTQLSQHRLLKEIRNEWTKPEDLDYISCINSIYQQLDGLSFEDFRIKELMDDFSEEIRINKIEKKSNGRIVVNNYIYYRKDYNDNYKLRYGYENSTQLLFEVLNYFEYGEITSHFTPLKRIENQMIRNLTSHGRKNEYEHFKKHKLNSKKIKAMRFYKNGRFDIYFKKEKYADDFYSKFIE